MNLPTRFREEPELFPTTQTMHFDVLIESASDRWERKSGKVTTLELVNFYFRISTATASEGDSAAQGNSMYEEIQQNARNNSGQVHLSRYGELVVRAGQFTRNAPGAAR